MYELCTFKHPFKYNNWAEYSENIPNKKLKVPDVKVNPKISDATKKMLKDIYIGLLNQDPKKRLSIQMVQERMHACLKQNKIVLPPKSQDYLIADFEPFFDEVVKNHGKTADSFKFQKTSINILGNIPL